MTGQTESIHPVVTIVNSILRPFSRSWNFVRRWPVIPAVVLFVLAVFAAFSPWIAPNDPNDQALRSSLAKPFWYTDYYENDRVGSKIEKPHILGADKYGRDVFSRVVYGARISLSVALVSMISGTILGAWAGITTGFYGGLFDELMTRFVDVWNALPFLLIALVVSITIGQGVFIMMILLVMLTWVGLVRNVRAEVLSLKTRDYVLAARVAGTSDIRLMYKHIFPGVSNLLLVLASLRVGGLILTEASLSFLGVGIPANVPSWGQMISDGRDTLDDAWWVSFFPGLGIFLTVMAMNFLGDWIRDRTDPRLRQLRD